MRKLKLLILCILFITTGTDLYAQPQAAATPIGMAKDSFFTNFGNKIYKMGRVSTEWIYAFDLPFAVLKEDMLIMPDETKILVIKNDTNLVYYNIASQRVFTTTSRQMIQSFCNSPIKKIIFHRGTAGCFAFNFVEDHYELDNRETFSFGYTTNKGNGLKMQLPGLEDPIASSSIQDFLKQLPDFIQKKTAIQDLGFTDTDFLQCKKDIIAFSENKKSDFYLWDSKAINWKQLLGLVDALHKIDPDTLKQLLMNPEYIVSTNSNSIAFKCMNTEGETLVLSASYYSEPNAFYFPWNFSLNGVRLKGAWPEISLFLKDIYPGLLEEKSKIKLLHAIVHNWYFQKTGNNL